MQAHARKQSDGNQHNILLYIHILWIIRLLRQYHSLCIGFLPIGYECVDVDACREGAAGDCHCHIAAVGNIEAHLLAPVEVVDADEGIRYRFGKITADFSHILEWVRTVLHQYN